jgi:hypothetical protein
MISVMTTCHKSDMHASAYVSIRQHTSAYASIRHNVRVGYLSKEASYIEPGNARVPKKKKRHALRRASLVC